MGSYSSHHSRNSKQNYYHGANNGMSILRSMSNTETKNNKNKKKTSKRKLSKDMIQLRVDNAHVQVGDTITGSIEMTEDAPTTLVKLVFEAIEYTVVALTQTRDNHMGLEYLEKHTSETNVLTSQQVLVDVAEAPDRRQTFSFVIPKGLPGTMRCILDGSDPILPSQYKTSYTITAFAFKNTSKAHVSQSITVSPPSRQEIPLDSSTLSVSVINPVKSIASTFFQCGSTSTVYDDNDDYGVNRAVASKKKGTTEIEEHDEQEVFLDKSHQLFSLKCQLPLQPHDKYCFAVGQVLCVNVTDWLGRQLSGVWMIQLIQEVTWLAKGRRATSVSKWNLFANHHELPTSLERSFDGQASKLSIQHSLVVFLATDEEDPSREVMACSEAFPIVIVSNTRGWDA
ncbi:unnamed protein product [Cylindrotheca closterium]|uniref:Uncharacterized protein n=1 Tax=Cylindrotheca closterium TaxID=2856 RepID=A0AAD2G0F7_9STRA|nr:unnamed protein product [Cylindrotheca closterium]